MPTPDAIEISKKIFLEKKPDRDGRLSGCTSYLQRHLNCSYNYANLVLTCLQQEEFITAPDRDGYRRLVSRGIEAAEEE